jgi:predicted aspartyl protease
VRFVIEGRTHEVWALVDTGFDGHLAIPETLLGRLPQPHHFERAFTASGQELRVAGFVGIVEVLEQPGPIVGRIIALGPEYLVGIQTLNHFSVTFDHGARVIVEP